jgi:thioredoxin-like negative regulator of GroEL
MHKILVFILILITHIFISCKKDTPAATTPSDKIITLTDSNYNQIFQKNNHVLVEFSAEWCHYCQELKPVISDIATGYFPNLIVARTNYDTEHNLNNRFLVTSLPRMYLIINEQVSDSLFGYQPYDTIALWLSKHQIYPQIMF